MATINLFTDLELREIARIARAQAELARETAIAQKGTSLAEAIASRSAKTFTSIAAKAGVLLGAMRLPPPLPDNVVRMKPSADHRCDRDGPTVEVTVDAPTCSVCHVPQVFD